MLSGGRAAFGASPWTGLAAVPDGSGAPAGASVAAARVAAVLAGILRANPAMDRDDVLSRLAVQAIYHGPQRLPFVRAGAAP